MRQMPQDARNASIFEIRPSYQGYVKVNRSNDLFDIVSSFDPSRIAVGE
jgi:hypothetical protein